MSVPGFNGRMIVGGNLTQNCSGCEFHNYDFIGDLPATAGTCSLTISSVTKTACVPATNTYTATVDFTYTNPPAGEAINTAVTGAATQNIAQPGTGATFTGLPADGAAKVVTAAFAGGSCTATNNNLAFVAPASCALATTVSGRVYREASAPANTSDDGEATDPGLLTSVALSCAPAYTGTTPINTAADGSYTFTNVPVGALCTITETQPAGYTKAYNMQGAGGTATTGGTPQAAAATAPSP